MTKKIKVLIAEDEPLLIGVLQNVLQTISQSSGLIEFDIKSVTNCDDASFEIRKAVNTVPFDFALLDISIPASSDKKILSGEDLGLQIRDFFPKAKIMVLTNHSGNHRLISILKSINPEGFIIKSDIDFNPLVNAIKSVLDNDPFYSSKVLQLMRKHFTNDIWLDAIDRQMIYLISKGAKTKGLIEKLELSKSGIEHRKRNLKMIFGIENGDDRELILKAEQYEFL